MADFSFAPGVAATLPVPRTSYWGEESLPLARKEHPQVFDLLERRYTDGVVGFRELDLFEERRDGECSILPLRLARCVDMYPHGEKHLVIQAEIIVNPILYSADQKAYLRIVDSHYTYVGRENENGEEII